MQAHPQSCRAPLPQEFQMRSRPCQISACGPGLARSPAPGLPARPSALCPLPGHARQDTYAQARNCPLQQAASTCTWQAPCAYWPFNPKGTPCDCQRCASGVIVRAPREADALPHRTTAGPPHRCVSCRPSHAHVHTLQRLTGALEGSGWSIMHPMICRMLGGHPGATPCSSWAAARAPHGGRPAPGGCA